MGPTGIRIPDLSGRSAGVRTLAIAGTLVFTTKNTKSTKEEEEEEDEEGREEGRKEGRKDGWMDGWKDGWMDGWTDPRLERGKDGLLVVRKEELRQVEAGWNQG